MTKKVKTDDNIAENEVIAVNETVNVVDEAVIASEGKTITEARAKGKKSIVLALTTTILFINKAIALKPELTDTLVPMLNDLTVLRDREKAIKRVAVKSDEQILAEIQKVEAKNAKLLEEAKARGLVTA